ncbi:hypothetical protein HY227_00245 [Candidatus Wolfebacteria bacterium]|nr:hypothetical protein [Candidatus Wolfebacteria bacterium]
MVLAAGVAGSYLIVKNPESKSPFSIISGDKNGKNKISQKSPIKWLAKDDNGENDNYNNDNSNNNSDDNASIAVNDRASAGTEQKAAEEKNSINYTQLAAGSLFGQMKKMDGDNKNPFKDFDINDVQTRESINQTVANFKNPAALFQTSIDDKDLKISSDNSKDIKNKYLELAANAVFSNPSANSDPTEAIDAAIKFGNIADVSVIADNYETAYDRLIKLSVPSDFLDIHKRYLLLLKNMSEAYRGIAGIRRDAIKSALALDSLSNLLMNDASLRREIYNKELEINSYRL